MGNVLDIGNLKQHYDKLTPEEKAIRISAFYSILEGSRSTIIDLSIKIRLSVTEVKKYVEDLKISGALVLDEEGAVVGSHGLSLVPTNHRLVIDGNDLFTWCAADAIGIPAALEIDAKIYSRCSQCNEPIKIEIVKGRIQYSNQKDTRIWVVEADLGRSIVGCT